jgi:hypothetical protein
LQQQYGICRKKSRRSEWKPEAKLRFGSTGTLACALSAAMANAAASLQQRRRDARPFLAII